MSVYLKRQSGSDSVTDESGLSQFPPEYVNFDNSHEILSITSVFCALAAVVVMLRFYVRAWMLRFVGSDDCIMLLAMVSILLFAYLRPEPNTETLYRC